MKVQTETLQNGIRYINVEMPDRKSATVLILVGTGSRYEDKSNNGIAHFIEHMLFKGTQNRPSATLISEEIDSLGADYNAFTSKEYTGFYVKTSSASLIKGIQILADMLKHSLFDEEECEKEKSVIIEEINMYADTPMRTIGTVFDGLVYSPHPLGFDTAGTKSTVNAFKRTDALEFINQWYTSNNMVIVTAGAVDETIAAEMRNQFSDIQTGSEVKKLNLFNDSQTSPLISIAHKKSDQAHFCFGLRSLPLGSAERYVMSVFNTVVGGNMSSRLFTEIREKRGLCYYISSDNDAYLDTGEWVIQAGVDTQRIEEALAACLFELNQIRTNGISLSEINKAKQYLQGRLALGLEESKGIANLYGINMLLEGKIRSPEEIQHGIESVSERDIENLIHRLIRKDKSAFALIGPYREDEVEKYLEIVDKQL